MCYMNILELTGVLKGFAHYVSNGDVTMTHHLDPQAAAEYLGGNRPLSKQTLAIYRLRGTGPTYIKIGRQIRYRRADLDQWLDQRVRQSTSQAGA